jgi:DNA-binding FadR family transcriptional regulator
MTLAELQQKYGISRTVARECMRILESLRMVRSSRRVGIIVLPMADWNVLDPNVVRWRLQGPDRQAQLKSLTELRIAIEPHAAALAAANADLATRTRLEALAQSMRTVGASGDAATFLDLDLEFHSLVLRSSGNEMFAALVEVVEVVIAGRTGSRHRPHTPVPQALDFHVRVAAAIAVGLEPEAREAMSTLLGEVRTALVTEAPA